MAASPFIVAAAQPVSLVHVALLLGALWSVGMVLYAIAMHDVPYAVVAAVGIVAAAVAGFQSLIGPLVFFGLLAGVPLACVGVVRLVQGGTLCLIRVLVTSRMTSAVSFAPPSIRC